MMSCTICNSGRVCPIHTADGELEFAQAPCCAEFMHYGTCQHVAALARIRRQSLQKFNKDAGTSEGETELCEVRTNIGEAMEDCGEPMPCFRHAPPAALAAEGPREVDMLERAWGLIANAWEGNWHLAPADWRKAAEDFAVEWGRLCARHAAALPGAE